MTEIDTDSGYVLWHAHHRRTKYYPVSENELMMLRSDGSSAFAAGMGGMFLGLLCAVWILSPAESWSVIPPLAFAAVLMITFAVCMGRSQTRTVGRILDSAYDPAEPTP